MVRRIPAKFYFIAALLYVLPFLLAQSPVLQHRRTASRPASSSAPVTADDTFDRSNANPIDSPGSDGVMTWTSGPGASTDVQITGNNAFGTGAGESVCVVNTPAFPATQRATVTSSVLGTDNHFGPCVRMQPGACSGYVAYLVTDSSVQIYTMTDTGTIGYVETGTGGAIAITAITTGDTIGLSASGTTLTLYRNGVSIATRTDSTYSTGQPGQYHGTADRAIDAFSANTTP